jgi:OmpA family
VQQLNCRRLTFYALLLSVLFSLSSLVFALSPAKFTGSAEVFFESGKSTLSKAGIYEIRAFVQRAETYATEVIVVVGFSAKGERNPQLLSEQRALEVVELLIKLGVSPSRIYSEGQSSKSAFAADTSKNQNRLAVLEFVGTARGDLRNDGFRFMQAWNEPILPREGLIAKTQISSTLLTASKRIQEPDLRQLFLLKLSLHSLVTGNDLVLLTIADQIKFCGSLVDGLPNPYLYALLWGTPEAKRALQKCNSPRNTTDLHRLEVFKRAFCESTLRRSVNDYEAIKKTLFDDQSWISSVKDELAAQLFSCSLSLERARWLLAQGIKLPTVSVSSRPLLFMAVDKGDIELTRTLLDAGSDVLERALGGDTVLHRVSRELTSIPYRVENPMPLEKQKELWDLLVARGANPEVPNDRGQKPKAP